MRPIRIGAARPAVFAAVGMTLAAGLITVPTSAGQAVMTHAAASSSSPSRAAGVSARAALARLMAAREGAHGGGFSIASPGETSVSQISAHLRTGMLTGVVRSGTGRPLAAACVHAFGPAGDASAVTRADGRYLLTGLRPGHYRLRAGLCGTARQTPGHLPVVSQWRGFPATVTVHAGQLATLPLVTVSDAGRLQLAPRRPGGLAGTRTGSISGRVTGNGRPLAGICVDVFPVNGGQGGEVLTSKTGRYRVGQLAPGTYQVEFADFGCQESGNWLTQWYPFINTLFEPFDATQFHVRPGRNIAGIDGKLKRGGEIAGTVRSTAGKRLGGICVSLTGNVAGGGLEIGSADRNNGSFTFNALFPGQYTVEFMIGCGTKGNYAFQWWRRATLQQHATVIHIAGHRVVTNINPALGPGATITGTVKGGSAAGPPLPGVCVNAIARDGNDYSDSFTSRSGQYTLKGLATGRYQIQFDPTCGGGPAPVNYLQLTRSARVTAGRTLPGFNAYLRPGGILSGKVTDARGRPLRSVCVLLGDPNGDGTVTNSAGTYSIIGIHPGSYTVAFFGGCGNAGSVAPQFYNNQPDPQSPNLVSFTSGKTTANIDAVMKPGGTIAGLVTDAAGHRLARVCVQATTMTDIEDGQVSASVSSAAGGRYVMRNLAPGPYFIEFHCAGGTYASQWFNAQPDSTTADLVSVEPGVITPATARLALAGSISGTITDMAGRPLSTVCVTVYNASNKGPVILPFDFNFNMTGPGRYRIHGLSPGRYLVQFFDCMETPRYGNQWFRHKGTAASATPVTVKPGTSTTGINTVMTLGGSITGVVTGPSGERVRGFCVQATDLAAHSFGSALISRSGRYTVTGLASGRYTLYFFRCEPGSPGLAAQARPGPVRVTAPNKVTGIDIRLEFGGSVSGRVTAAGSAASPQSGVCVQLLPVKPTGTLGIAFTGQKGGYALPNLKAGRYRAYFNDPSCQFFTGGIAALAPQWYNSHPTGAGANQITVTAGHVTTGIIAALRPYGSIAGSVTTGGHSAVSGECVAAIPVRAPADPFSGFPQPAEVAVSTHDGSYTIADLLAGRYKVEFTAGCGDSGFATQWWDNAGSATSAKVITVGFASITGINANLRH
ncbi:MAG TPA: carboxypeptidase-like regulatory domain-containing protein [Streptosporangiaceae bacterium]|nr:carboxypeptidase-like regulatory domain-containing protein [Streptosporangiaceae bacterium]